MHDIVPPVGRVAFLVHLIAAAILGLMLLLLPGTVAGLWGIEAAPGYEPVVRFYGAAILGLGAVTSFFGYRARSWDEVDFIVRGEIVYLALQTLLYVLALAQGARATSFNVITFVVTVVLLVLFVLTWSRRPASAGGIDARGRAAG